MGLWMFAYVFSPTHLSIEFVHNPVWKQVHQLIIHFQIPFDVFRTSHLKLFQIAFEVVSS